jgi:putative ABC transport system permease protein
VRPFRSLLRAPGLSLSAILVLALGLAAASALFSLLDRLLLRPVPYPESAALVSVWRTVNGGPRAQFNGFQFGALAREATSFEAVGAMSLGATTLQGSGGPLALDGARVSGNLLPLLRVKPALGRLSFTAEEDRLGGPGAVILTHRLWREQFGSDLAVLGSNLVVGGRSRRVVGVLPADFQPPTRRLWGAQIYLPIAFHPEELAPIAGVDYEVLGRLKPSVELAQANLELRTLASTLGNGRSGMRVAPLAEDMVRPYRSRMTLLGGAVALLLVLAWANAAALLLARLSNRQSVLVLQGVLGASPTTLAWEVAQESLGVGLLGALLGLLLEWPLRVFLATQLGLETTPARPFWVIPGALLLGLLSGLVAGLLPTWRAFRTQPVQALRDLGRGASPRTGARSAMVALEVALSFVLLTGSGLMLRGLWAQLRQGPGFETRNLFVTTVPLPLERQAQAGPWARELAARLKGASGMEALCVGLATPILDAGGDGRTQAEGSEREVQTWYHRMEGDVPRAFGMRLLEGRGIRPGERDAVLISQPLAQALWPDESALGHRLEAIGGFRPVVGVVEGSREGSLTEPLRPQIFQPIPEGEGLPFLDLVMRSQADPATLRAQVRSALAALDPSLAIKDVLPFERVIQDATRSERAAALPMTAMALTAVLLATFGLLGLLGQVFRSRHRELGVRAALGAAPGTLSRLVLNQGLRLLLGGLLGGTLGAIALARLLRQEIPSFSDLDPLVLLVAATVLTLVTALTSLFPALRAAGVQPAEALRSE